MVQNPMMGAPIQPAAPSSPQGLNFQTDPASRASFKGFMTNLNALPNISTPQPAPMASPMPAPMVPAADVDIFQPMPMQMQMGGAVPALERLHQVSGQAAEAINVLSSGSGGFGGGFGGGMGSMGMPTSPSSFHQSSTSVRQTPQVMTNDLFSSSSYPVTGSPTAPTSLNTELPEGMNTTTIKDAFSGIQGFADGGGVTFSSGSDYEPGGGVEISSSTVQGDDTFGGVGNDDYDIGYFGEFGGPGVATKRDIPRTAQDDIVGGVDLPFASITTSPSDSGTTFVDTSSMPTISEQAVRDQFSLGRGGFEPTAPAFSESRVQGTGGYDEGPVAATNRLSDALNLMSLDTDLLGFDRSPSDVNRETMDNIARDMGRGGQQVYVAEDMLIPSMGSAAVTSTSPLQTPLEVVANDANMRNIDAGMSMPMDAGEFAPSPRNDALSRELGAAVSPSAPRPTGDMMVQQEASRQATFGDIPRSLQIPPQLGELGAMGAGAFPEAPISSVSGADGGFGKSTPEQEQIEKSVLDALESRTNINFGTRPKGDSINALEQLGMRAAAVPGTFAGDIASKMPGGIAGIVGSLLGGRAAESMLSDITEKGYIPQYDSAGQIVATINPKTGQFGKGSVESRIAGYTPPEEGNEPGDTTFLIAGGGGSGVPAEEAAEIIKSLGSAAPAPTAPTTPSTPTPSQPAQLGRSLGFGYGTMPQVSSNLNMAMNNFFNMLGGYAEGGEVKKFASGGYTDTSSLEGLMEASGADTAAGQAIGEAMGAGSGDDGPPMNDFGGGDVQTVIATPVETQTVTAQPMQNQQTAADIMKQQASNLAQSGMQAGQAVGDFFSSLVAPSQATIDATQSMSSLSPKTPDLLNANMPVGGQLTSVPVAAQYADYKPTAAGIEQGIQGLSQVGTQRESGFSLPSLPSLSEIGQAIMGQKPSFDNLSRMRGSGAAPF